MKQTESLLLVSNYPSDTAYAWWLMEHFWSVLAQYASGKSQKVFVAYPKITKISERVRGTAANPIELVIPRTFGVDNAELLDFIRRENVKYVYLTDRSYFNPVYVSWRLAGVKRIIVHDHTPGDRPSIRGLVGQFKAIRNKIRWLCADAVFCVSPLMRERSIKNGRVPSCRCYTVQNGIVPLPSRESTIREKIRSQLGVENEQLLVITTGRLHPYKRVDFLIACARYIRDNAPYEDISFLILGDGPDAGKISDLILRHGLSESVKMVGFKENVSEYLMAADVALHSSLGEGFSLSILEYMSAGLATLVPNIPSVCQAIEHNQCGYIYQWDDVASAAAIVLHIQPNREELRAIGAAASRRVKHEFSLDKTTQDLLESYRQVILESSSPALPHL